MRLRGGRLGLAVVEIVLLRRDLGLGIVQLCDLDVDVFLGRAELVNQLLADVGRRDDTRGNR